MKSFENEYFTFSTNVFVNSETTPSMAMLLSPAQFLTTSCTPTMIITTQHITTSTVTCSNTHHCQPSQSPKNHQQCHNHLHSHNPTQKIIIQPSPTQLTFDPENIDFFSNNSNPCIHIIYPAQNSSISCCNHLTTIISAACNLCYPMVPMIILN